MNAPSPSKPSSPTPPSSTGAARKVYLRNVFLYSTYRKAGMLFLLSVLMMVSSASMLVYFATKKVPPRYLPIDAVGRVVQEKGPGSNEDYPDSKVLEFALDAANRLHRYDYINYKFQFQQCIGFFTEKGWNSFQDSLVQSGNMNTVIGKKLVVSLMPVEAPSIAQQKVDTDGTYKWLVKMKANIFYYGSSEGASNFQQAGEIRFVIRRVTLDVSPKGLGIESYNFVIG